MWTCTTCSREYYGDSPYNQKGECAWCVRQEMTQQVSGNQDRPVNMIWANEAGKCFRLIECAYGKMRIEIYGIVDLKETLLASATVEKHNRNRMAKDIATTD